MSGWRYSAQVPDFTREERQGEEIIVYYQVDVLVQAPGATGPAPPTTVWRRFSEFRQLHANLKAAFPELFKSKELDPPSKQSLRFVNNNDRLLHQRKKELEEWLWKLLAQNEIAHSRYMKAFFQLNLAVRGATTIGSMPTAQRDVREEIDDEHLDTSSDISAPSGLTNLSHAMTDLYTPGTIKYSNKAESLDAYRMGLRVEQRREIKHLVHVITTSLEKTSQEIQEVRSENGNLQRENGSLEDKVTSLNQIIKAGKYSQDEENQELRDTIKEKESTLSKTTETVIRLEAALSEAQRQHEALESEMRTLRQESAAESEKHSAGTTIMESKLDTQAVAHAKLEQILQETKNKARQDNRLLAETVRSLKQENARQTHKVTEQEEQLKQLETQTQRNAETERESKEQVQRLQAEHETRVTENRALQQRINELSEESKKTEAVNQKFYTEETTKLGAVISLLQEEKNEIFRLQQRWEKEKSELEVTIRELRESVTEDPSAVRLTLQIQRPSEETVALEIELERLQKENAQLQVRDEKRIVEETHSEETQESVANLDGLMLTIQQLQEQNRALLETKESQQSSEHVSGLGRFSELVLGLYREVHEVATTSIGTVDTALSPDQANAIIETVADSNGKLQLLKTKINDAKHEFQEEKDIPGVLVNSVTHLFTDLLQKCNEINEMQIEGLLSRPVAPSDGTAGAPSTTELPGEATPPPTNASAVLDDGTGLQGTAPSMRMFLGGIGARVSQGSQGFMSFMQRGAPGTVPADAEQFTPVARRSD